MSELDKKLKALDLEFLHGVPVHLTDAMVEQIKQAFENAGCTIITPEMKNEWRKADKVLRADDSPLMTGQEWYDNFWKSYETDLPKIIDATIIREEIDVIAKKATGIE